MRTSLLIQPTANVKQRPYLSERFRYTTLSPCYVFFINIIQLLNRDALGQVAGLVDVGALDDGDVVGEQLQRQCVDDGGYYLVHTRHRHHPHGGIGVEPGLLVGKDIEDAPARPHLFDVGLELLQQFVVGRHHDDRHVGIDQRQRAVFQLTGGIGLGVDVADLLELERPLHSDGVLAATAEEQAVVLVGKLFGQGLDLLVQRQGTLELLRRPSKVFSSAAGCS